MMLERAIHWLKYRHEDMVSSKKVLEELLAEANAGTRPEIDKSGLQAMIARHALDIPSFAAAIRKLEHT